MTILAAAPAAPRVAGPARVPATAAGAPARSPARPDTRYCLRVATDAAQVRAAGRLRHEVLSHEFGVGLGPGPAGVDADEFDQHCDHLIIEDEDTGELAGTYRLLPPGRAPGMRSDSAFDLGRLAPLRDGLVEAGRGCVHPDHRSSAVLDLLWTGVTRYLRLTGHRWLAGSVPVPLADDGRAAAAVWRLARHRHLAPAPWRVRPHRPWPVPYAAAAEMSGPDAADVPGLNVAPPLLRGYLRRGGWICGPPAYDPDVRSADFFVLLSPGRLRT